MRLASLFLFVLSLSLTLAPIGQAKQITFDLLTWQHWLGYFVWLLMFSSLAATYSKLGLKNDLLLLPLISLISGWGLLTVWRLAPGLGAKQTVWFIMGMTILIVGLKHRDTVLITLRQQKYIWLFSGLVITALTFIFGTNPTHTGPELWLGCCGVYLQPAEPLKLLLILFLAAYFADRQPFNSKFLPLIAPTAFMAGLTLLILIFQRDLGTASIFIFIYAGMIYTAIGKKRLLLVSLIIITIGGIIGYQLFDVVQLRVEAWLNPWSDPSGRSYQIVQSLISIAAGGLIGRGPGMGYPDLVPISFSDFIFTAIAEEYGFPGTLALILILLILSFRGLTIAIRATDRYQRYLSAGLSIYIASQSILIIGGNIRLLPLTGVTLPFLSYGGSSLLTTFMAVFLLISINQKTTEYNSIYKYPTALVHIAAILLAGFLSLIAINAWWSIYRGPELVQRADNARRTISDLYNKRGDILDRNANLLSYSEGRPGNFQRVYPQPEFSNVVGYTQFYYGQSGIEASLDPILRGIENQSAWSTWYYHLLYGQSPPGLDIKLTLDAELQLLAARHLRRTPGAIVLVDANNGEILIMYSSPFYDANILEEDWERLQKDPAAPLINRAAQSLYPPGASLAPFLIAQTRSTGSLPQQIEQLQSIIGQSRFDCTSTIILPTSWGTIGKAGCPAPLEYLGKNLGAAGLESLFSNLGFYEAPSIRLDVSPPYIPTGITNPSVSAIGQNDILVTPLQMALAAATLSNDGSRPAPKLLLATQDELGSWITDQSFELAVNVFTSPTATSTAMALAHKSLPIWESTAFAQSESGLYLTWYLGGTLPVQESNYAVAIVIERQDPDLVRLIGRRILTEVQKP